MDNVIDITSGRNDAGEPGRATREALLTTREHEQAARMRRLGTVYRTIGRLYDEAASLTEGNGG